MYYPKSNVFSSICHDKNHVENEIRYCYLFVSTCTYMLFYSFKVVKMKSTLERFQMAKLIPLKERLQEYHYTVNVSNYSISFSPDNISVQLYVILIPVLVVVKTV